MIKFLFIISTLMFTATAFAQSPADFTPEQRLNLVKVKSSAIKWTRSGGNVTAVVEFENESCGPKTNEDLAVLAVELSSDHGAPIPLELFLFQVIRPGG